MPRQRSTPACPAELRERGVGLFRENRGDHASDTAACKVIAPRPGCSPDSLVPDAGRPDVMPVSAAV